MLFLSGAADRHVPPDAARAAFGDLNRIWTAAGAAQALETAFDDAGHVFTTTAQARAFGVLERRLGRPD